MYSETWISSTQIFSKHGYPMQNYSLNMDIQYKDIPKNGIHGYSVKKYSLNMDIHY